MLLTSIQTIMVTGGCGFIGSNVVQLLLSSYPHLHVINVDKLDYNSSDPPVCDPARYTLVEQDVAQEDAMLQLLQERQVEAVLHFARSRTLTGPSTTRSNSCKITWWARSACCRRPGATASCAASCTSARTKSTAITLADPLTKPRVFDPPIPIRPARPVLN